MICPSCNTPNRDDAKFCKKCRYDFHSSAEMAKVPEAAMVNQISASAQEGVNEVEDISQAPTQIISPQQMIAFHANLWQKDVEQEHHGCAIRRGRRYSRKNIVRNYQRRCLHRHPSLCPCHPVQDESHHR